MIDPAWLERAHTRLLSLTKPAGSLGRLEHLAAQFVSVREEIAPVLRKPAVYIFAADHGVTSEGVSAYPSEVTAQMVRNFDSGGAAINVLARSAGMDVVTVDVGVNGVLTDCSSLVNRKIRYSARNLFREPAMTEDEMLRAIYAGFDEGANALRSERNLIAVGEMGIGNTTSAAAITAVLTACPASEVTGPGTGLGAEATARKASLIEQALATHFGDTRQRVVDPLDLLRCVGGLEIAALTGITLQAASQRTMIVLDGFIATAAAAIAFALEPGIRPFLFAGHQSAEVGHMRLLQFLGLEPILKLEMRLGEGTGAVLATLVIDAALKLYNEMATFQSAGVSGANA